MIRISPYPEIPHTDVKNRSSQSAFTLVELAIVLVIIGLIIGGVLVGNDLIRIARLNKTVGQVNRYISAMVVFKDKYNYLPGDMPTATDVWGAAGGDCMTSTDAGTGTQTYNGTGNGLVQISNSGGVNYCESYTFWKHLQNAQLIQGSFTGVNGPGSYNIIIGTNVPATGISSAGFSIYYVAPNPGGEFFPGEYGNVFWLGGKLSAFPSPSLNASGFSGADALWMDSKLDNGLPGTGQVKSIISGYADPASGGDCATSAVAPSSYNLASTRPLLCYLTIRSNM